MCALIYVATDWGRPTYGFDGEISTNYSMTTAHPSPDTDFILLTSPYQIKSLARLEHAFPLWWQAVGGEQKNHLGQTGGGDEAPLQGYWAYSLYRVRSLTILGNLRVAPLIFQINWSHLRWFGHLTRILPDQLLRKKYQAHPSGRRSQGWARASWRDHISQLFWEHPVISQENRASVATVSSIRRNGRNLNKWILEKMRTFT